VITTNDGRVLMSGDVHARGGPEAPMSRQEVEAKYMEFAVPVLGSDRAAAIRDAVLSLDDRDSRFSDLSALLYDPPKASS
ncbi:MAG: MmgE/PrpD family protein, partial [Mesorhizobium sp.]